MQWYKRVLPCAESMSSSRVLGRIFKILEAHVSLMSLSDGAARLNVPDRALVARTDVATESPPRPRRTQPGQRFGFSSGRTLEQRKSILTPTWDVALRQAREPERKQEQRQKQRLTPTPVQGLATVHKL